MHNFYKQDYQKFIEYNIKDVELVDRLEDKLRLIELCVTMAYDAGINYEDVFAQTRFWDAVIYNHLRQKNIVVPPRKENPFKPEFTGGHVKEIKDGGISADWVVSFDLNSLYPHLIMQYNISPETLRTDLPSFFVEVSELVKGTLPLPDVPNATMAGNGSVPLTNSLTSTKKLGKSVLKVSGEILYCIIRCGYRLFRSKDTTQSAEIPPSLISLT
jgi:DNA polymerase elongation subunit (family B)